jgi:hypothetical protein
MTSKLLSEGQRIINTLARHKQQQRDQLAIHVMQQLADRGVVGMTKELSELAINIINGSCQSQRNMGGAQFERLVEEVLVKNNISYLAQAIIDNCGIIIGTRDKRMAEPTKKDKKTTKKDKNLTQNKCSVYRRVDFIAGQINGEPVQIGESVTKYTVISCKISSRERWETEDWTLRIPPKMFIFVVGSDNYPPPTVFHEANNRRIVACKCKKNDTRMYKHGFNDLATLVQANTL